MPENNLPLLLLPKSRTTTRATLPRRQISVFYPSKERQKQRLNAKFSDLGTEFLATLSSLRRELNGAEPEHVIVLETVGTVDDFYKAIAGVEGMEWLTEFDGDSIDPDEDFHYLKDEESDLSRVLTSRLYFVSASSEGVRKLLSLWRTYKGANPSFPYGQGRWKDLFGQLKDVRKWNNNDRLLMTGLLEDFQYRSTLHQNETHIEIELWFREDNAKRTEFSNQLMEKVRSSGGVALKEIIIPEIRHHSIICRFSMSSVSAFLNNQTSLVGVLNDLVMFYRPTAQSIIKIDSIDDSDELEQTTSTSTIPSPLMPVAAILDGMPIANHSLLVNRLVLDDPDNLQATWPVIQRHHGTSMSSIVVHGDLGNAGIPVIRPVYMRPIFQLISDSPSAFEGIPESESAVDVIHKAILRIFKHNTIGIAPTVKIINLSFGEKYRPFYSHMSPLSRLLDWLSYEFNILFIVSAGNFTDDLKLDIASNSFEDLNWSDRQGVYVSSSLKQFLIRKILSPAESINAITVGASNSDSFAYTSDRAGTLNVTADAGMIAPYTSFGLGYRNAIKPDIIAPGGRATFRLQSSDGNNSSYSLAGTRRGAGPGVKAASPSSALGSMNEVNYSCGTSNATALVTRLACKIIEKLDEISISGSPIDPAYHSVATKCLIVHGTLWNDYKSTIERAFGSSLHHKKLKNMVSRMFGYGTMSEDRSLFAAPHKATTISFGEIKAEQAVLYEFPIPRSLNASQTLKRVVVTLSWISPVNTKSKKYRCAQLWFEVENGLDTLRVSRSHFDDQAVRRGTVQHEIFEGADAVSFADTAKILVRVNCKPDANLSKRTAIKYSLAITLESADRQVTTIYSEVRAKIAARARV